MVQKAALRIEVAGDSKIELHYLSLAQANALRNEILVRASGVETTVESPEQLVAPEEVIAHVDPADLALSLLIRGTTVWLLLTTAVVFAANIAFGDLDAYSLMFITGGLPLFGVVAQFHPVLRLHRGGEPRRAAASVRPVGKDPHSPVPPERVQAIDFVESWLWRRFGWVRLELNVAGLSTTDDDDNHKTATILLPVGQSRRGHRGGLADLPRHPAVGCAPCRQPLAGRATAHRSSGHSWPWAKTASHSSPAEGCWSDTIR